MTSPIPRPHIAPDPGPMPDDGDDDTPSCPACNVSLDVSQPGASPDRLLGACPGCGAWYLLEMAMLPPVLLKPARMP